MAAIEDLIKQVADPGLREQLAAEVARLKATKTFGLVFEEHLPELVRLPALPVRAGVRVMKKDESGTATYRVTAQINGKKIKIVPDAGGPEEIAERDSLVVAKAFGEPMYPALVPVDAIERAPGKPWHVLINADNYHALQLLLYGYEGKVDVIYIDPPYNSGARDWKYNNDYVDDSDLWRHSKWLSMMKKRLQLAKRLLSPKESVLIVTIDEREYLRLGLLLEELFAGCNIQMTTIVINPKGTGRPNEFSRVEEFAFFVFVGGIRLKSTGCDMLTDRDYASETVVRWRGLARTGRKGLRPNNPGSWYPIFLNKSDYSLHSIGDAVPMLISDSSVEVPRGTIAVWPPSKDGHQYSWSVVPETLRSIHARGGFKCGRVDPKIGSFPFYYLSAGTFEKIDKGEIVVTGRGPSNELVIEFPEGSKSAFPRSVWNQVSHDAGSHGTSLLQRLIPGRRFPFPKSLYAVEDALRFFVQNKPDAIILDFFGGSGTTTHAVARLNKQDGGQRRSILVTNNEVSASEAELLRSEGLEPGQPEWDARGVFEQVTCPRLIAAFTGRTPNGEQTEGNYAFIDEFPLAEGFDENIAFFRLDFLDPGDVTRGEKFESIVPILWMLAGCRGACDTSKVTGKWFMPKHNPFAVLHDEDAFGDFSRKLAERPDIDHVFLVTDSTEAFHEMAAELGRKYRSIQLYRSYIDTFRINLSEPGTITPNGVPVIPTAPAASPPAKEVADAD
jgi:adenine-specific DNA-methyltransferase